MIRILLLFAVFGVFVVLPVSVSIADEQRKYDHLFKYYSAVFFGDEFDWRWFKAQAIAESNLERMAVSHKGAQGVMQIMPGTGKEMAERLQISYRPLAVRASIMMGIAYNRELYNYFGNVDELERIRIMLAAYNCGPENIRRAMRVTACPEQWHCIATVLPRVTGASARETISYVRRVGRIWVLLKSETH